MELVVQESEKKQEILLVDEKSTYLGKILKKELKKYDTTIYSSPQIPVGIDRFDYIFLINKSDNALLTRKRKKQCIVLIFIHKKRQAQEVTAFIQRHRIENVKVLLTNSELLEESDLEKLFWFSFSKSKEVLFKLENRLKSDRQLRQKSVPLPMRTRSLFTRKRLLFLFLGIFLAYHLIIFPPFLLSSFLIYRSGINFKEGKFSQAKQLLSVADNVEAVGKTFYSFSRSSYLLFSLALFPDNLVDINEKGSNTLHRVYSSYENTNDILSLIFKKDKTKEEKDTLVARLAKLQQNIDEIKNNLIFLDQKLADLPFGIATAYRKDLLKSSEFITKADDVLPYIDRILAKGKEAKYLLLFANNMELRPGGGFIGSFGILTVKDLTLEDIKVYDVYDADGQLLNHINPPDPIRKYLNQPNWFLRDSAFSPDFFDNYNQAKYFLDQELKLSGFSGGILITTTAIQNLLNAYGTIYLPDFNEQITKDNFYLKAQYYAEKNFFPGSIQKKSFLGSVADQIIINVDTVSPLKLLQELKKSLDEKQIVLLLDDPDVQSVFDSLYWSGKTITPRCVVQNENCLIDYVFPIDANLGVNKANFFVSRLITQRVNIDDSGKVTSNLYVKLKNDSPNDIFPGGTYKNYFQVFLPKGSIVKTVTQDGASVSEFDEGEVEFKSVGFFVQLPPKRSTEISVTYELPGTLKAGKSIYQLIFQKQIGSNNSDFILEVTLPKNVSLSNQNFSPLVKDNRIFYNTSLSADKIFFLELLK